MLRPSLPVLVALAGCTPDEAGAPERALPMVWVRGSDAETWDQARAGLWWALSLLGAAPTDEAAVQVVEAGADRVRYTLDLERAGLDEAALEALDEAVAPLLESDEVWTFGAIDTGRLLMRTLYSPWRYYAITGACGTLDEWREVRLGGSVARFAVTDSLLVPGDREITLRPDPTRREELAWQAAEGEGALEDGNFEAVEHEVLDLMASGQQRFAVYGEDGALSPAALATEAGQPGRCMWCHEGDMQIISSGNADVSGYLTLEQFEFQLSASQAVMDALRASLGGPVAWEDPQAHAYGELLEELFLSPSAARLGREWGVPEEQARALVEGLGLSTHLSDEYPELPPLYTRSDVDAALPSLLPLLAPQSSLDLRLPSPGLFAPEPALPSARELDAAEIDGLDGSDLAGTLAPCEP